MTCICDGPLLYSPTSPACSGYDFLAVGFIIEWSTIYARSIKLGYLLCKPQPKLFLLRGSLLHQHNISSSAASSASSLQIHDECHANLRPGSGRGEANLQPANPTASQRWRTWWQRKRPWRVQQIPTLPLSSSSLDPAWMQRWRAQADALLSSRRP